MEKTDVQSNVNATVQSGNSSEQDEVPIPAAEVRAKKPLAFHMSFLALLIMGFICALDATVLGVAIPSITHELQGTTLEGFWASIAFLLAVVIVQPLYTSISNVFGRLLPLYTSYAFFIAGSIVFAVARNMTVVILGRVLQGLGAGGLDVLNEIILADITTLKERPMYLGYFAVPMLSATVLGPIVGGLFTQYTTWRWIGWINLPMSAIGLVLSLIFMRLKAVDQSLQQKLRRMDWGGVVLFTAGCTLFASPVAWAGAMYPWSSWKTLVPLVLGVLLLIAFGWYERKPAEPVFPYRKFKDRTAYLTLVAGFLHGVANYSITLYIPLLFQTVFLQDPLTAAVRTLPACVLATATSVISAVVVEIMRKYRVMIMASWVFVAVGAGTMTLLDRSSPLSEQASIMVIFGIGIGPFWSVLNLPIQACMEKVDDMGLAAGFLCSFRLFGGLVGYSISSTIFSSIFAKRIADLGTLPSDLAVLSDATESIGFVPLLRDVNPSTPDFDGVLEAYRQSIFGVFWVIAGVGVLGFVICWFLQEKSLEREELGWQQFEGERRQPNEESAIQMSEPTKVGTDTIIQVREPTRSEDTIVQVEDPTKSEDTIVQIEEPTKKEEITTIV